MNKLISSTVIAVTTIAFLGLVPRAVVAQTKTRNLTFFVKQDFSSCINSDVTTAPPAVIGGEALVTRRPGGMTEVNVRLTRVAPNTTYHVFLKCHTTLGSIETNEAGRGNNTFFFPTGAAGDVFAFDMYPEGAPLGNKFQSVQISFQ